MKKIPWLTSLKAHYLGFRGTTLFLASSPLWLAVLSGVFQGRLNKVALLGSALTCLVSSALITRRFFNQQKRALLEEAPTFAIKDNRSTALGLTALGTLLVSFYVFKNPRAFVLTGGLGGLAYYLHYMLDMDAPEPDVEMEPVPTDHLSPTLRKMVEGAYQHIATLEEHSQRLTDREAEFPLARKIRTITQQARHIIRMIHEKPDRIRAARAFFVVYLPELETVSAAYLEQTTPSPTLRNQFMTLLESTETAFTSQQLELTERQETQLNIQMSVLREQLHVNPAEPDERSKH